MSRERKKYSCPKCSLRIYDIHDLDPVSHSDSDSDYSESEECYTCSTEDCILILSRTTTKCCICKYFEKSPLISKDQWNNMCVNCKEIYAKKVGKCKLCLLECRILNVFDYKCCICRNWSKETQCEECKLDLEFQ